MRICAPARLLSVVHSCLLQFTLPHAHMIYIDSSVPSSLNSALSCTAHVPGREAASLIVTRITEQENLRSYDFCSVPGCCHSFQFCCIRILPAQDGHGIHINFSFLGFSCYCARRHHTSKSENNLVLLSSRSSLGLNIFFAMFQASLRAHRSFAKGTS